MMSRLLRMPAAALTSSDFIGPQSDIFLLSLLSQL